MSCSIVPPTLMTTASDEARGAAPTWPKALLPKTLSAIRQDGAGGIMMVPLLVHEAHLRHTRDAQEPKGAARKRPHLIAIQGKRPVKQLGLRSSVTASQWRIPSRRAPPEMLQPALQTALEARQTLARRACRCSYSVLRPRRGGGGPRPSSQRLSVARRRPPQLPVTAPPLPSPWPRRTRSSR